MWSQTKKKLENFTCDSLKDRVKFFSSNYRMHDGIGRTYIAVDGVEVYNMCTLKRDYYRHPKPGCYSQVEFMEAVDVYLNESIENLFKPDNPLIEILILLDRRIGKRTLINMKSGIESKTDIIQYFYNLRCNAEGIIFQ